MNANPKNKRLLLIVIFSGINFGIHSLLARQAVLNNRGISFGWDVNLAVIVTVWIILLFFLLKNWNLGVAMMIVGGLSNIIDRIIFGYVRDYWQIPGINLVNNVSDWLIGIGVLFFLLSIWMKRK